MPDTGRVHPCLGRRVTGVGRGALTEERGPDNPSHKDRVSSSEKEFWSVSGV